ncbi:MAG TPA: prepilin-type N-terminal cleavage/methylation domain-containing protein [Thermoanaerobaculia bacterium]
MNKKHQKGFTLIELLIVVAIIGILAAIAIPNLLTAMQRAKQKRTMADIRTIATAWEARATDLNKYNAAGAITLPAVTLNHDTMTTILSPTYIKSLPPKDGWGNDFVYNADVDFNGVAAQAYSILSFGRDGVADARPGLATTNFDCDIIYQQGGFSQYPEGVQQQ